jgi:hypothetical protein
MTKQVQWLVAARRHTQSLGAALLRPRYSRRSRLESTDQRFDPNALALRGTYMALLSGIDR